jgi:hypothetical protein
MGRANFFVSRNFYKNCFILIFSIFYCTRYVQSEDLIMKGFGSRQIQDYAVMSDAALGSATKCVFVAIFENDGKTILQPLVTENEAKSIIELFENRTLEVWLSNGKADISDFDVAILKYKQVLQSLTKCEQAKSQVCLKNFNEQLVSCEQCSFSVNTGEGR